jgi:hypothetical protein
MSVSRNVERLPEFEELHEHGPRILRGEGDHLGGAEFGGAFENFSVDAQRPTESADFG